jgi:hypothetical protein
MHVSKTNDIDFQKIFSNNQLCYGFDLFFDDQMDVYLIRDKDLLKQLRKSSVFKTIKRWTKSVSHNADGGCITYKWDEPVSLDPFEALITLSTIVTNHFTDVFSYTGSELYIHVNQKLH